MEEEIFFLDEIEETDLIREDNDEITFALGQPVNFEEEIVFSEDVEETDLLIEDNDVTTFDLRGTEDQLSYKELADTHRKEQPVNFEEEIVFSEDIEETELVIEDNDVTMFDFRETENQMSYKELADTHRKEQSFNFEEKIVFSEDIEETELVIEDNDVPTFEFRETEVQLSYKQLADTHRQELKVTKHNLDNAEQQMELMVEERVHLMTTIENINRHCLQIENKAAKSAEDAKAAFVWYTNTNNQLKDVIHQANKNHAKMQMENDQLQEQLQKLTKIKDAEAQDQRNMIAHLKKKMAEVENENNRNAKTAERFHRRRNEYKQQLNHTLMQSEKERITSQRTIANLQNNIRTLNEELKEYKKSVSNSEAEKIVSQRTITKLQTNIRNLLKELNDLKKGFSSVTDKLRGAEQKVIELTKNIDDQTQDKETASAKLDKLEKENEYLVNQLRSTEFKIELLNNSHETERKKHESSMKWMHKRCSENEIELEKHKNAHFNLLLQLDRVHNNSRISMEDTALFDKTFIEQKLEDERAKEEDLAEVTTNVIKKFASANDRHRVIKSFQKRIEKGSCSSPFGNDFLSDEDSHMEHFPTSLHEHTDTKQYNERLEENQNCQNKTEKNTRYIY